MNPDFEQPFPLTLGDRDDFARVESFLKKAGFDEPTILHTLKIEQMSELSGVKIGELDLSATPKALSMLMRVFLFSESLSGREFESNTGAETFGAFRRLDLLRPGAAGANTRAGDEDYFSPVFLYPVAGLLI